MKAFILAAGFGKRLRPLTETTPKPLLEVGGKPLIQYHIERLVSAGVTELVINAHWLKDKLIEFLGDGSQWGAEIHYSIEEELLETGGGIRQALALLGDKPFLLVNGDVYLEYSFQNLLQKPLAGNLAHLLLVPNPNHNKKGDFSFSPSGCLKREMTRNQWTYAGVSLIDPKLVSGWPSEKEAFPLLSPLLEAAREGRLSGEVYSGLWEDVGTPERLEQLHKSLVKKGVSR